MNNTLEEIQHLAKQLFALEVDSSTSIESMKFDGFELSKFFTHLEQNLSVQINDSDILNFKTIDDVDRHIHILKMAKDE